MRHRVAALSEVPEEGTLPVTLPGGTAVCLVRHAGAVTAFVDACTHQGMPLSAGEVLPDGTIECPWHGAQFDCATGAVVRGPAEDAVERFDVQLADGDVFVVDRD